MKTDAEKLLASDSLESVTFPGKQLRALIAEDRARAAGVMAGGLPTIEPMELADPVLDATDGPTRMLLLAEYWKRQYIKLRTFNRQPAMGAGHLPGWERGIATVTMNGHHLREALEFIAPDGDAEQMDNELTFGIVQHKDDDGKASTGLCCWNDDTDGVLPLDGEPLPRPTASGAVGQPDTARIEWMEKSLLREASMRFPDGSFKAVNAWSIASAGTDLREAIDAAMRPTANGAAGQKDGA